ncbi:hypothetical protein CMI38_01520 [Candidatus Pacearchaeota archaeon]|jgi:osmotically-inducible protein OsmY|nr:hypothetical protein [Candidatus Pacearchaeota archaeon]|tara:strand:+ start:112 stop:405 length:294 start_codon:yes stop_codon:yes gene_type:complete
MVGNDIGFGGLEDIWNLGNSGYLDPSELVAELNYEFGCNELFKKSGIRCNYDRGVIELTGNVSEERTKRIAGSLVNGRSGSYEVWNRIEVGSEGMGE